MLPSNDERKIAKAARGCGPRFATRHRGMDSRRAHHGQRPDRDVGRARDFHGRDLSRRSTVGPRWGRIHGSAAVSQARGRGHHA